MSDEPRLARRELGRRLRALRRQAGLTQEDVAAELDLSVATLRRIETGQTAVKTGNVLLLCRRYNASADATDAMIALAEGTRGKGLWEDSSVVPDWFGLYLGLEHFARQVETWGPELIHGLLQTEDYARALIRGMHRDAKPESVEFRVRLRLRRQAEVLGRASVTAILGPGALNVRVGSADIMRRQAEHLRALTGRPNVYVGVVPWQAGPPPALSPFTILSFEDPDDPDIAYVELDTGAVYLEKPGELMTYRRSFAQLRERSVPVGEYA